MWVFVGNTDVTRQVLEAGAKVDHVNSVGRTAAQMAAFVGKSVSCDVKLQQIVSQSLQVLRDNLS